MQHYYGQHTTIYQSSIVEEYESLAIFMVEKNGIGEMRFYSRSPIHSKSAHPHSAKVIYSSGFGYETKCNALLTVGVCKI